MFDDTKTDPLKMLLRRETQGPALIVTGCMLLYLISTRQPSTILYGFAALLGIIVLAGIGLTFYQLRRAGIQIQQEPLPDKSPISLPAYCYSCWV